MGSAAMHMSELATVIEASPQTYTYRVKTNSGRPLGNLVRKRTHPADVSMYPIGTTVIVRYDLPIPYIDGVLDLPMHGGASGAGVSVTGTTSGAVTAAGAFTDGANGRALSEPTDLIPGDYVMSHPSGSRVGALEGSVGVLVGSLLAQVRAFGLGDLVEIISRNYRHVTDFGVFEVKNRHGKIGLSFRGGTDQLTEAGNGEEHWTVRFDVGAEADLLDFRLTTPTGENLFHLHIDGDGRCNVYAADGIVTRSGSSSPEPVVTETASNVTERIGGAHVHEVGGARTQRTGQDARHEVGGTWDLAAVADAVLSAGRDVAIGAARRLVLDAQGDAASSDPALELRARNGDMLFKAGHAPRPKSKIRLETLQGDIEAKSTAGGNITFETLLGDLRAAARKVTVDTSTPDSVVLGGRAGIGHAAIYEPLERVLIFLATSHDAHVHPGPFTPPVAQTVGALRGMLTPVKSRRVMFGG